MSINYGHTWLIAEGQISLTYSSDTELWLLIINLSDTELWLLIINLSDIELWLLIINLPDTELWLLNHKSVWYRIVIIKS